MEKQTKVTKATLKTILKNFLKMENSGNLERLIGTDLDWFNSLTVGTEILDITNPEGLTNDLRQRLINYICAHLPTYRIVEGGNGGCWLYYKEGPKKGAQHDADYCDVSSIHHY